MQMVSWLSRIKGFTPISSEPAMQVTWFLSRLLKLNKRIPATAVNPSDWKSQIAPLVPMEERAPTYGAGKVWEQVGI